MDAVFVAWSRLSRRTVDLAKALGADLLFVPGGAPYLSAFLRTRRYLREARPSVVLVQLPQGPLLWEVLRLSKALGFSVVADVHTSFVYHTSLRSYVLNRPFVGLLREVDLALAHNDPQRQLMIDELGLDPPRVVTVYDPLPAKPESTVRPEVGDLEPQEFLVLPASWAGDEPIDLVVREFLESRASREYRLVVTGNYGRNRRLYRRVARVLGGRGGSVVLTGYLRREEYHWLVENCRAAVALTSREYTMMSALWEAVAYGKPFIASETRTLRSILGDYPCFFRLEEGDARGVLEECVYSPPLDAVGEAVEKLRRLSAASVEELKRKLAALRRDRR